MAEAQAVMRLQKFLAQAGAGSRRSCESLITAGRVRVNGQCCMRLGTTVDPHTDRIELDGKRLLLPKSQRYIVLNKPEGYLVSRSDPHQSQTIYQLLPPEMTVLHPVGRLDQNSCGLLLLTNDGDLTEKLLHPRFKMEKVYHVQVRGRVSETALKYLREGVDLSDGRTRPARVVRLRSQGETAWLEFGLREGRNRQIRRMCRSVGLEVIYLKRISFGPLQLGTLPVGAWRDLSEVEVRTLIRRAAPPSSTARKSAKARQAVPAEKSEGPQSKGHRFKSATPRSAATAPPLSRPAHRSH